MRYAFRVRHKYLMGNRPGVAMAWHDVYPSFWRQKEMMPQRIADASAVEQVAISLPGVQDRRKPDMPRMKAAAEMTIRISMNTTERSASV